MENTNYSPDMMIKNNSISDNDVKELQSKFITEYATKKGWNVSKLTKKQLAEIKEQKEYKKAGLLFS